MNKEIIKLEKNIDTDLFKSEQILNKEREKVENNSVSDLE